MEKRWNLAYVPVTANRLLQWHWAARRREGQTWSTLLATGGPAPRRPPWKARVSILVRRKKVQDPDNAVASLKPVLDALVRRGWLWDDSGRHLELQVEEVVSKVEETRIVWTVVQAVEVG